MRRYYDFADHKLALRNIWLRQRQSTWELKSGNIPKVDPDHLNGLGTTYYVYPLSLNDKLQGKGGEGGNLEGVRQVFVL